MEVGGEVGAAPWVVGGAMGGVELEVGAAPRVVLQLSKRFRNVYDSIQCFTPLLLLLL